MISNEMFGSGIIKIKINGYLKNNTENERLEISTTGIKNKNKITFLDNDIKYTIKINKNEVYLLREGKDFFNSFVFNEKKSVSSYFLKENSYSLDLEIITSYICINEDTIHVIYKVVESDCDYEFKIGMSGTI